jgi:hypothetical protein
MFDIKKMTRPEQGRAVSGSKYTGKIWSLQVFHFFQPSNARKVSGRCLLCFSSTIDIDNYCLTD